MRPNSAEGFERPKSISAGAAPMLQRLKNAADLVASEPGPFRLLMCVRYPVPADKQAPGRRWRSAPSPDALRQHGEATLITALHCVTQTANNESATASPFWSTGHE